MLLIAVGAFGAVASSVGGAFCPAASNTGGKVCISAALVSFESYSVPRVIDNIVPLAASARDPLSVSPRDRGKEGYKYREI